MTSLDAVTAWVRNYRRAWESNDPGDIGGLFTDGTAMPMVASIASCALLSVGLAWLTLGAQAGQPQRGIS